jgi:hypothetical protein
MLLPLPSPPYSQNLFAFVIQGIHFQTDEPAMALIDGVMVVYNPGKKNNNGPHDGVYGGSHNLPLYWRAIAHPQW